MKIKILVICLNLVIVDSLASVNYAAQRPGARAQKRAEEAIDEKLISCVKIGDAGCVRQALAAGAKANAEDAKGVAALILAAEGKSAAVVRALLNAGADVNRAEAGEATPLCRAALFGRNEIVELLLARKAKINIVCDDNHGDTPLMNALRGTMYGGMTSELREDIAGRNEGGESDGNDDANGTAEAETRAEKLREVLNTPAENFLAVARSLLARGADVNAVAKCKVGETALMYVALGGNVEIVKELLAHGADVDKGASVLTLLQEYDRELEKGKRLPLPAYSTGQAAMLEWSEKTGAAREEIKRLLKAAGAKEVEAKKDGEDGEADADALEETAAETFSDVIEKDDMKDFTRLVDAYSAHPLGAVVLPRVLRIAVIYERTEMLKLLLERGTNPNPDSGMANANTPLQQAAYSGKLEYVRMLLDAGADVNREDKDGRTALDAAESRASSSEEHRAVVELLKARGATSKGRER